MWAFLLRRFVILLQNIGNQNCTIKVIKNCVKSVITYGWHLLIFLFCDILNIP